MRHHSLWDYLEPLSLPIYIQYIYIQYIYMCKDNREKKQQLLPKLYLSVLLSDPLSWQYPSSQPLLDAFRIILLGELCCRTDIQTQGQYNRLENKQRNIVSCYYLTTKNKRDRRRKNGNIQNLFFLLLINDSSVLYRVN